MNERAPDNAPAARGISDEKKKAITQCVLRLVLKNSGAFHLVRAAFQGLVSGDMNKQVVSQVFGFDPASKLPVEDLVAESLLNGLDADDIDEIFRRYAARRGLRY